MQSANEHSSQSCKEEVLFDFISSPLTLEYYTVHVLVSAAKIVSLHVSRFECSSPFKAVFARSKAGLGSEEILQTSLEIPSVSRRLLKACN